MSLEAAIAELTAALNQTVAELKDNTSAHTRLTAVAVAAQQGSDVAIGAPIMPDEPKEASLRPVISAPFRDAVKEGILTGLHPPVGNPGRQTDRWWSWHLAHPFVYDEFEHFAFVALARGLKRFSSGATMAKAHWENDSPTDPDQFPLRRDCISLYARLFMHLHKEHDGFFYVRKMKR
jgi:hypothetical protein